MKAEKVIVYDGCCPMCAWYTGVFVNTGLLPRDGRQTFSEIDGEMVKMIDTNKSRHEIPLIDRETGQVTYGVDAILQIVGARFPWVNTICRIPVLNWIIRSVYKTISYNRRVIVAAGKHQSGFDSTPDFSLKYRSVLLIVGFLLNSAVLFPLTTAVFQHSLFATSSQVQVQMAHLIFVVCNIYAATHFNKHDAFEYLGQINILAITAMLCTLPLIVLNNILAIPATVNNIWLAGILFLIVKEYFRRMKYAGLLEHHSKAVPLNIFSLILFLLYLSN